MKFGYPDKLEIRPVTKPVNATIRVPGSKSITNRALVLAALASRKGPSVITGALRSDDTEVMIASLRQLGFAIAVSDESDGLRIEIKSTNPLVHIPARAAELAVGNSGTTMRFLAAMVSLAQGEYRLDGDSRMRERPINDLLSALQQLGVDARSERANGCPPVVIRSNGLLGGKVQIRGDVSSQFLSGLLMAAPLAQNDIEIELVGPLVSMPYVLMTMNMVHQFDAKIETEDFSRFRIAARQTYMHWRDYVVEPDATSASYFFAAAAVTGGRVRMSGLHVGRGEFKGETCHSGFQGDVQFLNQLTKMGNGSGLTIYGIEVYGHRMRGIDTDMNWISDTVMTLAAVACFAEGPTTIRNVAHIRHKETDRIAALATELRKLGVEVDEFPDGLKITPRPMHGAELDTYNDHRMAMSLALIGLKVPGVVIKDPGCVAKTYPGFWQDFEKLYQVV